MLEIQISNFPATSHECLAMNYESFLSVHLSTSPKSVDSFLSVGQRDNPPLSLCSKMRPHSTRGALDLSDFSCAALAWSVDHEQVELSGLKVHRKTKNGKMPS